jgi:hypothetical protein
MEQSDWASPCLRLVFNKDTDRFLVVVEPKSNISTDVEFNSPHLRTVAVPDVQRASFRHPLREDPQSVQSEETGSGDISSSRNESLTTYIDMSALGDPETGTRDRASPFESEQGEARHLDVTLSSLSDVDTKVLDPKTINAGDAPPHVTPLYQFSQAGEPFENPAEVFPWPQSSSFMPSCVRVGVCVV